MRISFVNFTKTTVAINTKLTSNSFTHHIITFELCWRDGIPFSLCLTAVLVNQTNFGVVKQQHVMKYCQSRAEPYTAEKEKLLLGDSCPCPTIYTATHQHVCSCCVQSKGSLWIRLPPPNYAQLWPMFHFLANIVIKEGKLNKFRRAHKLLINILRKTMIKQPWPWDLLFGGEEARRRVS